MNWGLWGQWCLHSLIGQLIWSVPKQGDSRNVSRPVARIHKEANIGHLPTKFRYNQMQGWKVINRYRILEVNFHILPHLTFDLLMWPLTPEYHGGQYRHLKNVLTKFGYKQMQGWKVINCYRVLQVNFHIWPLTAEYHGGQYRASTKPSLVTNRCRVGKLSTVLESCR